MKIFEERDPNYEYKDTKSKIEVMLQGVDSAIVTKVVNKWQEWKDIEARLSEARRQAQLIAQDAKESRSEYENMLRSLEDKYFDVTMDSAKTKVIRTMSYLIKLSKKPVPHENVEVDYQAAYEELVQVLNASVEIAEEVLRHNTKSEMFYPRASLYTPVPLQNGKEIKESFIPDAIKNLIEKTKIFFNKLLNKLKVCDSILDRIEEKYLK